MSIAPSFVTPLRYPGGKGRLGAWLADLIQHNGLQSGCYVEPYAGGAGAAVYLLVNGYVDRIIINDADPVVYAFWWALLNETDRLVDLILSTPVTIETWHEQREVLLNEKVDDLTKLGFATFFLNRTNRSGIIKGGVIGGQSQEGKYKIDARYNKEGLAARVSRLAGLRERINLFNMDAMEFLEREIDRCSLIYLDPPYYKKGSQLYRNHYKPSDHAAIAERVKVLEVPWLVSYDNCAEIAELYSDVPGVEFSLHYSTHNSRPKAKELLFYGNIALHASPIMRR
ncbi:DNA adenine methylase [Azotobacter beijerinckii]|uniref:site-specific DNA-methyltransferase (adenine-specific) n=1 Tax=Azotobacter beijerinckii TaxID=170623 RepID=A0A1H7ACX8_9GAMM|nr:DNA adenine methylase [Azotobacter beijerinckii]SEJ63451.1 DNA adenine methylase [Azotobacter beijerinckii]